MRIGPCDANFFETPIVPEIEVYMYTALPALEMKIENKSINSFSDYIQNGTIHMKIVNPGSAKLHLEISDGEGPVTILQGDDKYHVSQPDLGICISDESLFEIHFDGEPRDIGSFNINVASMDEDMLSDFEFGLIKEIDCEFDGLPSFINQYVPWYGYDLISKDIYIKSGGTLEIFGVIAMNEQSDIFVEPGGKLILNGGKITGTCNKLWNGIDLWGSPRESQHAVNQGLAQIINGGCIEFAKKGIETAYYDGAVYNRSGGIVLCDSAFFRDNQIAIKFYPYQYTPPGSVPVPNFSKIKNTVFETTNHLYDLDYTPASDPINQLYIGEIWGLNILGCNFINSSDKSYSVRGNGIFSMNGGCYVARRCTDLIPLEPCSKYEGCTFENLDYGIRALSDGSEWIIDIDTATFIGNYGGIFMSGIHDPIITRCTFDCSDELDRFGSHDPVYGLYLEYCNRYQVEENTFLSSFGSTGQEAVGLHILNSGPYYNEIYNNTFSDFHTGVTAAGDNRDEYGTGLCLKCNNFYKCPTDVNIIPNDGTNQDYFGIATEQGIKNINPPFRHDLAAGNTFSDFDEIQNNFYNEEHLNLLHYVHHRINSTSQRVRPFPYANTFPEEDNTADYDKDLSCPSNLSNGSINTSIEKLIILIEDSSAQSLEDTISLLIDGGDTPGIEFEIQTSFPDEALQLRQDLLSESPYLSDTILKSAIAKENVLVNAMIRDILVANPQSAKTPSVLIKIEERTDPMPDYMMAEIMEGVEYYGAKEILVQNLAKHKSQQYISFGKLMRHYKTDTTNHYLNDSLVNVLAMIESPYAEYEKAFVTLSENDTTSIDSILNNILVEFTLSIEELETQSLYVELFDILTDLNADTCGIDSVLQQRIVNLYNATVTLPGIYARNLLIANDFLSHTEPVYLANYQLKKSPAYYPNYFNNNENTSYLRIFPNPSKTYFIIAFNLREFVEPGMILISDQQGRKLKIYSLRGNQNQIIISNHQFSSGLYFVRLYIGNRLLSVEKVVIQ
jgi:hypothetical protein